LAQGQTKPNIFSKYKVIKLKIELLKANTYTQFWKQIASSQHGLLSAFDTEQGRMQMDFLQPQVPFPKSPADYKKKIFCFDTNQIHLIDQMDMHK